MDIHDAIPDELRERHGFPKDVWIASKMAVAGPLPVNLKDTDMLVEVADRVARWAEILVAKAIMAERQRCADVAQKYADSIDTSDGSVRSSQEYMTAAYLSVAIRGDHQ